MGQHVRCYGIDGYERPNVVDLLDQFLLEEDVEVGQAVLLCLPVKKIVVSGGD